MGIRETINQNSAVATVGAIVLAVIACGIVLYSCSDGSPGGGGGAGTLGQQWFLDEGSGKLFIAEASAIPPITAPSGEEGVRAYVFTCEKACPSHDLEGKSFEELEELGLFVGYVEKVSARGLKEMERFKSQGDDMAMSLILSESLMEFGLVRTPKGKTWLKFADPRASRVQSAPHSKCKDRRFARPCVPGMQ